MNATDPCTTAQHPNRVNPAGCPIWCPRAGHHAPDNADGARIHTAPVGRWMAVVQVDHPGGRETAVIAIDDVELSPDQVQQFGLDLAGAASLIKAAA